MPQHSAVLEKEYRFDNAPMLVYWETTRACDLACLHCRAEADTIRDPFELKTDEAKRLCDEAAAFGGQHPVHLVLTGGDPLKRADLPEIVDHARRRGLTVSVTPAAGPNLDAAAIRRLAAFGVGSIALSLDGSTAERHDTLRGVSGTYERTLEALRAAATVGLPVQVNTLVAGATVDDLPAIYDLLCGFRIERWALFFLITTGRGATLREISPTRAEEVLSWLCGLAETAQGPFIVKSTEAHHVRRIAYQRLHARGADDAAFESSQLGRGLGVRDGNGVVFVSRRGEIFPSGFLPLAAGNLRTDGLVKTYRESSLFRALRDGDQLRGKCGRCAFRFMCGGSRARAYAASGDPLESDPLCLYPTIRFDAAQGIAS